ncbi:MAG: Na(+)/H(+) antiporter subunit D [Rhodobacteraceae bacterium]|nr:Na(+)/H(+) antiporter subunit D [Paracoccaceae bacterium]
MIELIPTSFIFFLMAGILALFPHGVMRGALLLITPLLAVFHIWYIGFGNFWPYEFFGFDLELMRVDRLSRIFVLVFCLASFLGNMFAWHVRDTTQQVAALLYAGSAIGAALSGDMISLFFYWEATALASVFLIWARGTEGAYHTGLRYLIVQIGSGVILIAGVCVFYQETGEVSFNKMTLESLGTWLIFISFGIKCAFPLMHNWLQDSYPAATVTGAVILSAFTTKMAIYALARGFAGTEILIYIGTIMTLFPIFFAEIENDMRRVLSYSLNNQLGFMVVAIGIGSELALNGMAGHAFAHILYKALLFMSVGAVLYRTGTAKASELGGLYRTMPLTAIFCLIGAASISAFPLLSGFVTKSLTLSSVAVEHRTIIWLALVFASAGVLSHSGIKIPFFTFFAHDSGKRPAEAPKHMLIAMGITSALCILIGIFPATFYQILPYETNYVPYTFDHVFSQLQLLFFALLAFAILYRYGFHPAEIDATNLDTDIVYRKWMPSLLGLSIIVISKLYASMLINGSILLEYVHKSLSNSHGPKSARVIGYPSSAMVVNIIIVFALALIVIFVS